MYKILLQYPDQNNIFEITQKEGTNRYTNKKGEVFLDPIWVDNGVLTGFSALNVLQQKLDEPKVTDKYLIITLNVVNP